MIEPPDRPFADVVVGLADEPQLDARAGERAERLAGRAAQLEPDRTVELAALEGAGERRPRTSGRRWSGGGRDADDGALAAERRRDPDLEARTPGAWPISRPALAGSARRAADAGHGDAPMTGASSARAIGDRRGSSRRLSPTISPTDRAPTAASSRRRSSAMAVK